MTGSTATKRAVGSPRRIASVAAIAARASRTFLALVPLLDAIVLSYGIVAEPATVMRDMTRLTSVMPADAAKLIGEQLPNVVRTSDGKKGLGLLLALALAMTGAAVLVAVIAMVAIAALGHLQALLPTLPDRVAVAGKIVTYGVLVLAGAAGAATLYRFGPPREQAGWVWLTPRSAGCC